MLPLSMFVENVLTSPYTCSVFNNFTQYLHTIFKSNDFFIEFQNSFNFFGTNHIEAKRKKKIRVIENNTSFFTSSSFSSSSFSSSSSFFFSSLSSSSSFSSSSSSSSSSLSLSPPCSSVFSFSDKTSSNCSYKLFEPNSKSVCLGFSLVFVLFSFISLQPTVINCQNVNSTLSSSSLHLSVSSSENAMKPSPMLNNLFNTQIEKGNSTTIKIGYLTNLYGRHSSTRQGLVISGAISYAIDRVNKEGILGKRKLELLFNDTSATSLNGTAALLSQWQSGAVAFFGPEDTCEVEGTIAGAINLPMISYKCASSAVSNKVSYPTFVRTQPPEPMVVRSVLALLRNYSWLKFAIVWSKRQSEKYEPVISALKAEAERLSKNETDDLKFKVTVEYAFEDPFECCINSRDCCGKTWQNLVQSTYEYTRIYIFFGGGSLLPYFLLQLKTSNLLENGEYMVISVDLEEDYSENQSYRYVNQRTDLLPHELEAIYDASRSLLVIAKNNPQPEGWSSFEENVRHYNKLPPFNLKDSLDFKRYITFYAAYLYDAVMIYAQALKKTLDDGLTERNGREIVKRIINRRRFKSIIGNYMYIDENGDVQGNFSVLQPNVRKIGRRLGRNSEHDRIPGMNHVGSFVLDESTNRTKYIVTKEIVWFKPGHAPLDEPECGFDGKRCEKMDLPIQQILLVALLIFFLATVFLTFFVYRNWKYEQEIDGLSWKISQDDIIFDEDKQRTMSSSRVSLISNTSYAQTRIGATDDEVSTKIAHYKGAMVAMKELRFPKSKKNSSSSVFDNLTREHKKEMKYMKEMHHKNINPFIGACSHPDHPGGFFIVREYCSKGSLRDILENHEIKFSQQVLSSLIHDILSAIQYLHKGEIRCHGNLKSSNCLISSRWTLKLCDFGLHELRAAAETDSSSCNRTNYNSLWKAPEILHQFPKGLVASPEADIYSFGIIMHEMLARRGPFCLRDVVINDEDLEEQFAKEVVKLVKQKPESDELAHRPDVQGLQLNSDIIDIMRACWRECPKDRPSLESLRNKIKNSRLRPPSGNIVDNMIKMMEIYSNQLEELVNKRTQQLDEEKLKVEQLLHQMLPVPVARQLIQGEIVKPEAFDSVTIFFSDIVGFTSLSAESTPMEVVAFLNDLYTLFDSIISNYDVYKVETIGDAYMVVSGLPIRNGDKHSQEIASMALEMLEAIQHFRIRHRPTEVLQLRIGLHTGSVVSGVVGRKMPRYCLFGDTVNTASRMESNGEALKIHISSECRDHLEISKKYLIEERGLMKIKGKGEIRTYWLKGHIDGPKPRMKNLDQDGFFALATGPTSNVTKSKPHITFLEDEISLGTSRKGSLVVGSTIGTKKTPANGRNMIQASIIKFKGLSHSNSCSSFGPEIGVRSGGLSPRTGKRNWGAFRLFNGKARSASTKEAATEDTKDVHALTIHGSPSQTITSRFQADQTRLPKGIIKSPSYNTIESFNLLPQRDRIFQIGATEPEEIFHLNETGMGVLDVKFDFNQTSISPVNFPHNSYDRAASFNNHQQQQQQESSLIDSDIEEQTLLSQARPSMTMSNCGVLSSYNHQSQHRQKSHTRKNSLVEEEEENDDDDDIEAEEKSQHEVYVDVHTDDNSLPFCERPLLPLSSTINGSPIKVPNGELSILVDDSENDNIFDEPNSQETPAFKRTLKMI